MLNHGKNFRWDPGLSLGGSIIFWPCACWILKEILGKILVCHLGGSIIFWPCACWILISPRIFFKDSTCTWSKDDWPPNDRPGSHLEFFFKIQHAHGQKMIDPPIDDRPGSHLEFFFDDSTCTWSKDDWPSPPFPRRQTRMSPRIFFSRFNMHMVKRWLTPHDRPGSHLEFFLKIQHAHGQKMIDPPTDDRPGSHLELFFWRLNIHIVKRWLTLPSLPQKTDQNLTYNFFFKIQHAHGQKMIEPHWMKDQDLT